MDDMTDRQPASQPPHIAARADIDRLLTGLPEPDAAAEAAARARQDRLTKPRGALGRLEDMAVWLASWQAAQHPYLDRAQALVFAGNHGVAARGVSAFPAEVTAQMVANFEAGGAAINQLAEAAGATLDVHALALDRPTRDFTTEPAMDEAECLNAMARGMAAVDPAADVLILGEMGIANSTVAAALATALLGGDAADWVGPGTGHDAAGVALKARVVADGIARHQDHLGDAFEVLRRLGGREQAAIAGAVLAARRHRVPVILDGFICCAAALVLDRWQAGALDHCLAGHVSAEPGHRRLLAALDKQPVLDLGMRLGEGTGAAVALTVLRGAVAAHTGMATFGEAGVSDRD